MKKSHNTPYHNKTSQFEQKIQNARKCFEQEFKNNFNRYKNRAWAWTPEDDDYQREYSEWAGLREAGWIESSESQALQTIEEKFWSEIAQIIKEEINPHLSIYFEMPTKKRESSLSKLSKKEKIRYLTWKWNKIEDWINEKLQRFNLWNNKENHLTNKERLEIIVDMANMMWVIPTFQDWYWNIDTKFIDCNDLWIWAFDDDLWLSNSWNNVRPISWAHFSLPNDKRLINEYWTIDIYIHSNWKISIKDLNWYGFHKVFTFNQRKKALNTAKKLLQKINNKEVIKNKETNKRPIRKTISI